MVHLVYHMFADIMRIAVLQAKDPATPSRLNAMRVRPTKLIWVLMIMYPMAIS